MRGDAPACSNDPPGVMGSRLEAGTTEMVAQLTAASFGCSVAVCAINRFNSGMQDPQLVPAFSRAPISPGECAPAAISSQIVLRPTPKQAQTIGPALASPSLERPDNSTRR